MAEKFADGFVSYGLAGLLAGSGTIILFIVLKWVMATMDRIIAQAAKERELFTSISAEWIKALNEHTILSKTFHDEVKESNLYQRQEHMKLMEMVHDLGKS